MTNLWWSRVEKRPALAVTLSVLWVILIGGIAFLWHLGSIGLIDETEPLFAEASRQMFVTGDWITPFFNAETRFDKPALIYWCQAIAFSILGVNEWAVRLPSALAAIGLIGLAFYTIQRYFARKDELEQRYRPALRWITAGFGTAVMALNPEMIVWGRTGVSDMLLTGCMASALLCFFLGYAHPSKSNVQARWYIAFYVLIAAAILTKGPVGIVLPGLIIGIFLLYLGNITQVLQEMRPLTGLLIVICLSLPWYVLVIWRNGWDYINSFFGYHNVERFTTVVNRHSAPWYFYFVVVLLGFAPYSVYLPLAMGRLKFWQRKYWRSQERSQQLGLFAFCWFVGIFGFFTIAVTKLPSYVLPLMPAAAILMALLWGDLLDRGDKGDKADVAISSLSTPSSLSLPRFQWIGWVNVVFLSAIAVTMFYLPQIIGSDPAAPDFRNSLERSGLTILGGVIWIVSAIAIAVSLMRRRYKIVLIINIVGFAAFLTIVLTPALFLMDRERQLPLRELSEIVVQTQKPGEELVMVGFKKPTVVFYTRRTVTYKKISVDAAQYLQDKAAKKPSPSSVLVLAQPKKFPEMGFKPTDYENLGTHGAYQLVRFVFK
ncbi:MULTISPECIES: ArnT family glycosyltransferase [Nostocales]|uniref:Glycosyltransferase n=3 Tax=Nostocales TaxID=1161 RepID=A0A0C1NHJ2_9CYAN|nr:glycosyltransferase family 39 protein [Tolypothrix bouteillei]KAF3890347.1 glycosyltransferase family 39 protein [Tolypothrix bouteillei VB521301]